MAVYCVVWEDARNGRERMERSTQGEGRGDAEWDALAISRIPCLECCVVVGYLVLVLDSPRFPFLLALLCFACLSVCLICLPLFLHASVRFFSCIGNVSAPKRPSVAFRAGAVRDIPSCG